MRSPILILAALSACALSSGCVTAAAGAAASVGLYAMQERTLGEGTDDAAASQEVKTRLMATDRAGFAQVDVEVSGGSLLLSGTTPSEEHRQTAELIARNVRSVHTIYNEILVGQRSGVLRNAQDEWITAQIRARLTASAAVRAINVNIETFNGKVYLMGYARSETELQRAAEIASTAPGVQRVISFMQIRSHETGYAAAPPPAPTASPY